MYSLQKDAAKKKRAMNAAKVPDGTNGQKASKVNVSGEASSNTFLNPRQKLRSLRGGLAKKGSLDNSSFAKRSEHDKNIFSSITLKITTRLGSPRVDAPTLPGSRKLQ